MGICPFSPLMIGYQVEMTTKNCNLFIKIISCLTLLQEAESFKCNAISPDTQTDAFLISQAITSKATSLELDMN